MAKKNKPNKVEKLNAYQRMLNVRRPLKGLIALINEYYWKSVSGPFLTFVFPLIMIGILGWLLGYYMVLGGSLTISVFAMTLTSMPIAIYEFKSSSLLKRIGATPIKPWLFITVIGTFYLVMMIVSLFWTILMCFLLFVPYVHKGADVKIYLEDVPATLGTAPSLLDVFKYMNWGGFILSEIIITIIGVTCGLMLASLGRNAMSIQVIGVVIMILTLMLSACLYPPYLLRRHGTEFLWWTGYFLSPFKPAVNMAMESLYWKTPFTIDTTNPIVFNNLFNANNSTIFNCSVDYKVTPMIFLPGVDVGTPTTICSGWEKGMDWGLPFVWIGLFVFVTLKKFKWSNR